MAHQLKSRFDIACQNDISSLARLYGKDAQGSLTFTYNVEKRKKNKKNQKKKSSKYKQKTLTVPWTSDPFGTLYRLITIDETVEEEGAEYKELRQAIKDGSGVKGHIISHLQTASTLLGVAQQPTRLDRDKLLYIDGVIDSNGVRDDNNENSLVVWANYIDERVHTEMCRENDIGHLWERPRDAPMPSMHALFTAIRLSRYATHCLPCRRGFVVTNTEAIYPVYISIDGDGTTSDAEKEEEKVVYQVLAFDKDDGFLDVATWGRATHLNKAVEAWHRDRCTRPLQSYMDQYGPEEAYAKIHKNELTEFTGGKRKREDDGGDDNDNTNPAPNKKDKKSGDVEKRMEYVILRHIAISICGLDLQSTLASLFAPTSIGGDNHFLEQFSDCGVDGTQLTIEPCWDYVCVGQEGGKGPYKQLAELIDEAGDGGDGTVITSTDIGLTLRRLTNHWIETYPYRLVASVPVTTTNDVNNNTTQYRLVPHMEHGKRLYKAVDYRVSPRTGMAVIAVSVAYLMQRLGDVLTTVVQVDRGDDMSSSEEESTSHDTEHHEVHVMDDWDEGYEEVALVDNEDGGGLE